MYQPTLVLSPLLPYMYFRATDEHLNYCLTLGRYMYTRLRAYSNSQTPDDLKCVVCLTTSPIKLDLKFTTVAFNVRTSITAYGEH